MESLAQKPNLAGEVDQYLRAYNNAETWLAEVLDGSMRTEFSYSFDGQELLAEDGQPLGEIFSDSVNEAEKIARQKPNLLFELRRRQLEREEYHDMLAMARDEAGNTMVVLSDFPPELMDSQQDIGGYNVRRKQTMMRVLSWQNGEMVMRTQSLDGSNRQALESIYQHFGFEPEPGELLGQRISVELEDTEEQTGLIDRLTGIYDQSLSQQFSGQWYAGRRAEKLCDTYAFVRTQPELIDLLASNELSAGLTQKEIYNIAALMTERFEEANQVDSEQAMAKLFDGSKWSLDRQLVEAGRRAAESGQQFSGCGGSVGGTSEESAEGELAQSGYGNKSNEESSYKFDKYMFCVGCQAPPKNENESKKMCGPCGLCRTCDKKYGGKG